MIHLFIYQILGRKFWTSLLLLSLLDFVIIWLFVRQTDPNPSVSIAITILVPFVVVVNLIFAGILFAKKRRSALLFVINSFISAILMYSIYTLGISRHQRQRYESWNFSLNDTLFIIDYHKPDSTFIILYSTNLGSSTSFDYGRVLVLGKNYILINDSQKLTIRDNYLFGFRGVADSLKLNKLDL